MLKEWRKGCIYSYGLPPHVGGAETPRCAGRIRLMTLGKGESRRWAELCERHETAVRAVDRAFQVVQNKFLGIGGPPGSPSHSDLARLEDARAERAAVEREMDEFMTTRR